MEWMGLALLVLVGIGIIATGLPAAIVLITIATFGAIIGVAAGAIDASGPGWRPATAGCRSRDRTMGLSSSG